MTDLLNRKNKVQLTNRYSFEEVSTFGVKINKVYVMMT